MPYFKVGVGETFLSVTNFPSKSSIAPYTFLEDVGFLVGNRKDNEIAAYALK